FYDNDLYVVVGKIHGVLVYVLSLEEGNSAANIAVAVEKTMGGVARIDDSQVNSKTPSLPPPNVANATPSAGSSSVQRNPHFYIERARDLVVAMSLHAEPTKSMVCELAYSSMDELSKVAVAGEPLWQPRKGYKFKTMDDTEYRKSFRPHEEPINELQIDASRDMKIVNMNAPDIVHLLMNVTEWSRTFYDIVSRGAFLGVFKSGVGGSYDGKLQVMTAEFQFPSPFLATRECYFGRYCKKLSNKMWGVVDFSLEKMFPDSNTNFLRRPSGCLIKELSNEYSEVIWVEHAVDRIRYHIQFRPVVYSGLAFGASRWLASLVRRVEYSEPPTPMPVLYHGKALTQAGKIGLLNVASRMMRSFYDDMNASSKNRWMHVGSLVDSQEVKIRVKDIAKDCGTGNPKGTKVFFSTFVSLPTPPKRLFDFLRVSDSRKKDGGQQFMVYLQESYIDTSTGCSYVVYSPIEKLTLSNLINGRNPHVAIESSGFTIVPDGKTDEDHDNNSNSDPNGGGGSILTISFCIMTRPTHPTSFFVSPAELARFNELSTYTINAIKGAVLQNNV
ncbi:Homeobox-leucine zipper protein PROTODERMAL FACTOR 2, partial [Mucuna pruriens]